MTLVLTSHIKVHFYCKRCAESDYWW